MPASLTPAPERARKMASLVLHQLADTGLATSIAASMGVSESTISRLRNDHLDSFCELLAYAGLNIVRLDARYISREKLNALIYFAKAHLTQIEDAEDVYE